MDDCSCCATGTMTRLIEIEVALPEKLIKLAATQLAIEGQLSVSGKQLPACISQLPPSPPFWA